MNFRLILGLLVMSVGIAWPYIEDAPIFPQEPSVREALSIEKPTEELLSEIRGYDNITDSEDRDKLAIFSYEFSKRVPSYNIDAQKLIGLYGQASRDTFGVTMTNKYEGLENLVGSDAIKIVTGNKESIVSEEKAKELSRRFSGTAWLLGGE